MGEKGNVDCGCQTSVSSLLFLQVDTAEVSAAGVARGDAGAQSRAPVLRAAGPQHPAARAGRREARAARPEADAGSCGSRRKSRRPLPAL